MKPLFDLCSAQLRERIKTERKEKLWRPFNDEALVQIQKKLTEFNSSNTANGKQQAQSVTSTSSNSSLNDETNSSNDVNIN